MEREVLREHRAMPVHLSIAGRSDIGRSRKKNEDALLIADLAGGTLLRGHAPRARFEVGKSGVLLAVSDGIGGGNAGEVASAMVLDSLARNLTAAPHEAPADVLIKDAVQVAHRDVLEAAHQEGRQGMGATLTAILVQIRGSGATAFIAEVGDSRAYLLRAGRLTPLTKDQSYVQVLLDAGTLDAEQAAQSPMHNVILQAMGRTRSVKAALGKLELRGMDCLLLCSDGLPNEVADDEISRVVLASRDLDEACKRLVDLANERGGKDNITVLAAGVDGDLAPSRVGDDVARTFQVLEPFEPSSAERTA
jgi:serine/threonine protein phosphatase PrpC